MVLRSDEVFRRAAIKAQTHVANVAASKADKFRQDLERFLEEFMRKFYHELLAFTDSGEYYIEPLTYDYWIRKLKSPNFSKVNLKGSATAQFQFLRFSHRLMGGLLRSDPITTFGKPRVTLRMTGEGLNTEIARMPRTGYNRPITNYQTTGRLSFLKFTEAYQNITFHMKVSLYPKAMGKKLTTVIGMMPLNPRDRLKLTVFEFGRDDAKNLQRERPLLKQFMAWYSDTKLRTEMNKFLKGRR